MNTVTFMLFQSGMECNLKGSYISSKLELTHIVSTKHSYNIMISCDFLMIGTRQWFLTFFFFVVPSF
uniref:Uncharacterized protein n=1 Tax=Octopus bimaculoides TaxID=37653 RepID=A0A0L8I7Z1_OCTBM